MNIPSYKSRNITILIIIAVIAIIIAVFMTRGNSKNQEASLFNAGQPAPTYSYEWKNGGCYYNWVDAQGNSQSQITDITKKRDCHAIVLSPNVLTPIKTITPESGTSVQQTTPTR